MNDMQFACRYGRPEPQTCTRCGAYIFEDDDYKITDYGEFMCITCYEDMYYEEDEQ